MSISMWHKRDKLSTRRISPSSAVAMGTTKSGKFQRLFTYIKRSRTWTNKKIVSLFINSLFNVNINMHDMPYFYLSPMRPLSSLCLLLFLYLYLYFLFILWHAWILSIIFVKVFWKCSWNFFITYLHPLMMVLSVIPKILFKDNVV